MAFFHTLGDDGLAEITDGKMASYSVVFEALRLESLASKVEKIGDCAGFVFLRDVEMGKEQTFKAGFCSYKSSGTPCRIVRWGEKGYKKRYLKIEIMPGKIYCYVRVKKGKCDYLETV
ncbi:MAG: hypothetical protein PHZ04_01355 [Patescibacteria group bacterium]|nr:hypothetical protein [Patescibacteria group bacterium]MDD5294464.1 hypothetical protein [Patescibacteria group bacterium]MDD5554375.1 hypothetical protein [Patescibacteria group bacterium]